MYLPELIEDGLEFLETMPGTFVGQSLFYSGNLWEETSAKTGGPLNPWNSPAYEIDRPWIGDPWQELAPERVNYVDADNPPGMTDMEQARLVRLALGTAIDRQSMIDAVDGYGAPLYSEYMGPRYPGWDPSRQSGVWSFDGRRLEPSDSRQSVPWQLDDGNFQEAGRLLDLAGFPIVDGVRQIIGLELIIFTGDVGEVNFRVGDAIRRWWAEIGVEVAEQEFVRDDVVSKLTGRTQFQPMLGNGNVNSNIFPPDWPYPQVDSSLSRPGLGVAFETPYLASQNLSIGASKDVSFRVEEHFNTADYMIFWQLYNGVIQLPRGVITSGRIKSWTNPPSQLARLSGAVAPEFIVLRK